MARVLVVDDDLSLQKALELFLTALGHEVFKASDGLQALELTKALNPEIIILDLMMPKMNGLEVCKKIKEESSIPIIILAILSDGLDQFKQGNILSFNWTAIIAGTILSAVVGYYCVKYFIIYLSKHKIDVFAYYCLAVGLFMFLFFR
jgi:CheY-like chemotaxis protein